jgi:hypothetical protein
MPYTVGALMNKQAGIGPKPMGMPQPGAQAMGAQQGGPVPGMALGMPGTPQVPQAISPPQGGAPQVQQQAQGAPWSKGEERAAWRSKVQDIRRQRESGVKHAGRDFWAQGGVVSQPKPGAELGGDISMDSKRAGLKAMMGV